MIYVSFKNVKVTPHFKGLKNANYAIRNGRIAKFVQEHFQTFALNVKMDFLIFLKNKSV